MHIIVWGINYAPEVTGIAPYNTALCEFLFSQGHRVQMVTAFPYYPSWKKTDEDKGKCYCTEDLHGVTVHRCWHYVPEKVSALKRILHEATFVGSSFFKAISLRKPDLFIVISPPLILGLAAWIASALRRAPFLFHVQDLQPDAALQLGMLKNGLFARVLYKLENLAYRKAVLVSGISKGMVNVFIKKGVPKEKLVYFPNAMALPDSARLPSPGHFRAKHHFRDKDFLAVYSGNIGIKQGLDVLIETARYLKNECIKIIICGEGAHKKTIANLSITHNLQNVILLPLQEKTDYENMLVDANLCLITQQSGSGQSFFPSKLLTALSFGKPIFTVSDSSSELAKTVQEGQFGLNISPGHPQELAKQLELLFSNPNRLQQMGIQGWRYVEKFEITSVLTEFEQTLRKLIMVNVPKNTNS